MMTLPELGRRYDEFGWHYAAVSAQLFRPGEDTFYAALALTRGGPALEPACGAGRILATLADAGVDCWGTDRSAAMLALAAERVGSATLIRQDLQALRLPARFGSILLPLEAVRLLPDAAAQVDFLRRARAHLLPRGRLALDLTLPAGHPAAPVESVALDPRSGKLVTSVSRWRLEADTAWEETTIAGTTYRDAYRLVSQAELEQSLTAAGFAVAARYADFRYAPYRPGDPTLVLVARPEEQPCEP